MRKILCIVCFISMVAAPSFSEKKASNKTSQSKRSTEYILRIPTIGVDILSISNVYTLPLFKLSFDSSIILQNGITIMPVIRMTAAIYGFNVGIDGLVGYTYKISPAMYLSGLGGIGVDIMYRNFCIPFRGRFDYFFTEHHGINAEISEILSFGSIFINHFSLGFGYSYKF